jgi:hypothetical protein
VLTLMNANLDSGLPYGKFHHDCRKYYLNFESALARELKFAFLWSMLNNEQERSSKIDVKMTN